MTATDSSQINVANVLMFNIYNFIIFSFDSISFELNFYFIF